MGGGGGCDFVIDFHLLLCPRSVQDFIVTYVSPTPKSCLYYSIFLSKRYPDRNSPRYREAELETGLHNRKAFRALNSVHCGKFLFNF